jgi:hypothetical protein
MLPYTYIHIPGLRLKIMVVCCLRMQKIDPLSDLCLHSMCNVNIAFGISSRCYTVDSNVRQS